MISHPNISVIIPVFNAEKYISEAIQSVIGQTYNAYEIIVVDDGSTDQSAQLIHEFREVSYHYKPNSGLSSTLNFGLQKVKGDYIAFLDADDYWSLDKLERQIKEFEINPKLEIVFGHHKRFYNKSTEELTVDEMTDMLRTLPAFFKASLLVKVESFFKVGLFDETIVMGDFLDWYRRAIDMNLSMKLISDVVLYRRVHNENMSLVNKEHISDYVKIMKASLDRRRGLK